MIPVIRDAYVEAGARVILRRALAASGAQLDGTEPTDEMARLAVVCDVDVATEIMRWKNAAMTLEKVHCDEETKDRTTAESWLMFLQARRAALVLQREEER